MMIFLINVNGCKMERGKLEHSGKFIFLFFLIFKFILLFNNKLLYITIEHSCFIFKNINEKELFLKKLRGPQKEVFHIWLFTLLIII
jgi:hypothetical protein